MKTIFPFIVPRSHTPLSTRKVKPKLMLPPGQSKSIRNISVGPLTTKNSFHSNSDSISNPRAISDEVKLSPVKDPFITSTRVKPIKESEKIYGLSKYISSKKQCSKVIIAIFTLYNCEKRIQANDLISLFTSLNLTNSADLLSDIFKGISAGLSMSIISYSKQDLLKICEDIKTQKILNQLLKDSDRSLSSLVSTIQKWWGRLDKDQKGSVSFDCFANYLTEIGAIDSSSDLKRLFLMISDSGTFTHFFSFFCKSLLKFLLVEVSLLIGENKFISPEISILEVRRKIMLNNLESTGKIFSQVCDNKSFYN